MTLLILLSLLVAATLHLMVWRNRGRPYGLLAVIFLFYLTGNGPFVNSLLNHFQLSEYYHPVEWQEKNIIVILGAGSVRQFKNVRPSTWAEPRLYQGLGLYNQCRAKQLLCYILVSGGDPGHVGETEAATMARSLVSAGVPETHILQETQSLNTIENAQYSAPIIAAQNPNQVVIVTSGTHMTRALKFFKRFKIDPVPSAADYLQAKSSPLPYSQNFFIFDRMVHELLGYARYFITYQSP